MENIPTTDERIDTCEGIMAFGLANLLLDSDTLEKGFDELDLNERSLVITGYINGFLDAIALISEDLATGIRDKLAITNGQAVVEVIQTIERMLGDDE